MNNNMADWAGERPALGGKRVRYKTQRTDRETRLQSVVDRSSSYQLSMVRGYHCRRHCSYRLLITVIITYLLITETRDYTDITRHYLLILLLLSVVNAGIRYSQSVDIVGPRLSSNYNRESTTQRPNIVDRTGNEIE